MILQKRFFKARDFSFFVWKNRDFFWFGFYKAIFKSDSCIFFYKSIEWIVATCAVLLLVTIPLQYVVSNITHLEWYINVICGVWGMDLLLVSRVFRIAAIEVDEIRDNNYLFGLFAAMTSIISIIVAIIALAK